MKARILIALTAATLSTGALLPAATATASAPNPQPSASVASSAAPSETPSPAAPSLPPAPSPKVSKPAVESAPPSSPVPGRYIVVLKDRPVAKTGGGRDALSAAKTATTATAKAVTGRRGGRVGHTFSAAMRGFSMSATAEQARDMAADPAVASVRPVHRVKVTDDQVGPDWGTDRIDQRNRPINGTYAFDPNGGSGVTAFIIDTGIRPTDYDFEGRAQVAADYVGDGMNGIDCAGHGTHVAGTIGGNRWGVAKAVQLRAVRVLDCDGSGWDSDVIAGVDYVTSWKISHPGQPVVANMSLGGGRSYPVDDLMTAVGNAVTAGVTMVVAAGNEADDACNYSPSATPSAITVAATDRTDTRPWWSNYGGCVDLFAPGVGIISDWYTGDGTTNVLSGTSMASPHVAGVAALYLAHNPGDSPAAVTAALTGSATPGVVSSPIGSPNLLLYSGTASGLPTPAGTVVGHGYFSDGSNVWLTRGRPYTQRAFYVLKLPGVPPPTATVSARVYQYPGAAFRFDLVGPDGRMTFLKIIYAPSRGRYAAFAATVAVPSTGETGYWWLLVRTSSRSTSSTRGFLDAWSLGF